MSESHLMLIRHPETVANTESRYIGRTDSPLSDRGVRQRAWLENVVAPWGADVIYTSPLGRALDTARAIAPAGCEVRELEELQEIDFGQAERLTYNEIVARGLRLEYTGIGPIAPGGETGAAFDARVQEAIAIMRAGSERAVVVTHGGVMRRLLMHLLQLPVACGWHFGVPNATVAVVRIAGGVGVLERLTPPPDLSDDRA